MQVPPPYPSVQFVGYNLVTDPPFAPYGVQYSLEDDARVRAVNICHILDRLWDQNFVSRDTNVLKVFLAPEFFFRPLPGVDPFNPNNNPVLQPAVAQLYSFASFNEIINIIQSYCNQKGYHDWFIVPGTILSMERSVIDLAPVYFNTVAYFYKGFWGNIIHSLVHKLRFSDIDRLNTAYQVAASGILNQDFRGYIAGTNDPVSFMGKIQIGIEICLDHLEGTLKEQLTTMYDSKKTDWMYVNMQLLSSCGMTVKLPSVMARNRGFFFRCDGHPYWKGVNLYQVSWSGNTVNIGNELVAERTETLPAEYQINPLNPTASLTIYPVLDLPGGA